MDKNDVTSAIEKLLDRHHQTNFFRYYYLLCQKLSVDCNRGAPLSDDDRHKVFDILSEYPKNLP